MQIRLAVALYNT